jgi:DNA-binding CsgD family transcriptional regulator
MGHVMIEVPPAPLEPYTGAETTARGALCQRERCPYGTPCADTGGEALLVAVPTGAAVVCAVDHRVVWTNGTPFGAKCALERHVAELVRADGQRELLDALNRAVTTRVDAHTTGSCDDAIEIVVAAPCSAADRQRVIFWRETSPVTAAIRDVLDGMGAFALVAAPDGDVQWLSSAADDVLTALANGDDEPSRDAPHAIGRAVVRSLEARAAAGPNRTAAVEVRLPDGSVRIAAVRVLPRGAVLVWGHGRRPATPDAPALHPLSSAMDAIARELAWAGYGPARSIAISRIPGAEQLNERERETLLYVAQGLRSNAIAQRMFVSGSTIRNYLSAIYRKVGVANHAELVELLFSEGDARD